LIECVTELDFPLTLFGTLFARIGLRVLCYKTRQFLIKETVPVVNNSTLPIQSLVKKLQAGITRSFGH